MKKLPHKHAKNHAPVVIPRAEHSISRRDITPNALRVLNRLHEAGYSAYLVGGGVRDLLLGLHPKDFDVATNAHPEQVRKLFTNSRLIGRRFRIVHVFFGREIVEVATFRKSQPHEADEHEQNEHGILLLDNAFGTIEEDAVRRDFTVNALYYNIADFTVVDYVNGMADLQHKIMRLIGEPGIRFREDPVRMLRAIRLAAKLDFKLDKAIATEIPKMRALFTHVSKARLFDELIKVLLSGKSCHAFTLMLQYDLLDQLMPTITQLWRECPEAEAFAKVALINTDKRISIGKSINPAFMLAVLFWHILLSNQAKLEQQGETKFIAFDLAISETIHLALKDLSIPRRFTTNMREIWSLQRRFIGPINKRCLLIPELPRFRAGYDFLLLRAEVDPSVQALADWWTTFYEADPTQRAELLKTKQNSKELGKKK